MRKELIVLVMIVLCVGFVANGCASICHGSRTSRPKEARDGIDGVMLLGDIFITGLLGLIIDFANGAIYKSKPEYREEYPALPPMEKLEPVEQEAS